MQHRTRGSCCCGGGGGGGGGGKSGSGSGGVKPVPFSVILETGIRM